MNPRRRLACLPTPLHRLPGLERMFGLDALWVKRDDLAGFALAGNKSRPLEFLLGDALARDSDVLVTGGAAGSNYCQAVAVAAAGLGLDCELVIAGRQQSTEPANLAVARGVGARISYTDDEGRDSVDLAINDRAEAMAADGRRPYPMPRGGATPVGGLGFAAAAVELQQQLDEVGLTPEAVVLATGSGGTQAGLLAGASAAGALWEIHGASVSRSLEEMTTRILELAIGCSQLVGGPPPGPAAVHLVDAQGDGFGVVGADDRKIIRDALAADGIVLDPTYTAKALRVAVELARNSQGPIVFWHTGGTLSAVTAMAGGKVYR